MCGTSYKPGGIRQLIHQHFSPDLSTQQGRCFPPGWGSGIATRNFRTLLGVRKNTWIRTVVLREIFSESSGHFFGIFIGKHHETPPKTASHDTSILTVFSGQMGRCRRCEPFWPWSENPWPKGPKGETSHPGSCVRPSAGSLIRIARWRRRRRRRDQSLVVKKWWFKTPGKWWFTCKEWCFTCEQWWFTCKEWWFNCEQLWFTYEKWWFIKFIHETWWFTYDKFTYEKWNCNLNLYRSFGMNC